MQQRAKRVLVTGATGFLGFRVMLALLEIGAEVTALVRPDRQEALLGFGDQIRIVHADVWNRASLKGHARGQDAIVHLVGSTRADPTRGLTYNQINLVSARHVTGMAVSDGVPHMVLLSTVVRPGELSGEYVLSKRDAEDYLRNSGLEWTIVRAPALYEPRKNLFLSTLGTLGGVMPVLGRYLPFSADIAAYGIAGIALNPTLHINQIIYAEHLRRLARISRRSRPLVRPVRRPEHELDALDDTPFGWLPHHSNK